MKIYERAAAAGYIKNTFHKIYERAEVAENI